MPAAEKVSIVLLCAASGTGLTDISNSLKVANPWLEVRDLERLVCTWYTQTPGGEPSDSKHPRTPPPKMATVARRPRRELYESWRLAWTQILNDIVMSNPSDPAVVSMHLTWYNPDTSEFFSPIDFSELDRDDCLITHVVILIDDIYDMYYRLRGSQDLYADEFMAHDRNMLKKLVRMPEKEKLQLQVEKGIQAQVIEQALGELLTWRRSEMIQAENMAQSLGAKLTVLGTKHDERVLRTIVSDSDSPRIYLSHRITEHRRYNMDTRTPDIPLGEWLPAVEEVNALHQKFADVGQVLINPTAIDELRFQFADADGRRDPLLMRRWPMPEPEQSLLWERAQLDRGHEHTEILTDDSSNPHAVSCSVATSLANKIFFEIAFRDHVIVENTPNLCVYRPFFCMDMEQAASKATWSSGVNREIKHWENAHTRRAKGLPAQTTQRDDAPRRIGFVHTTDEIRCRIRWLLTEGPFGTFIGNTKRHLVRIWEDLGLPHTEISALFVGQIPKATAGQLGRRPEQPVVLQKPREVFKGIGPAVQIALHLVFASINRPGTPDNDQEDVEIGLDQVALYAITETGSRGAEDLDGLVDDLRSFFAGELDERAVKNVNDKFWNECDGCFEAEKEVVFERYVAQKLGIDYGELQRLARPS